MTSYDEALKKILAVLKPMEVVEQPLMKCIKQVLAEDVVSGYDLPQMPSSMPDGYAVRSADIVSATMEKPVVLKIIDSVRAGSLPHKKVRNGTATRIMTGSIVPEGADCVIRFEDTDEPENKSGPNNCKPLEVKIFTTAVSGDGIRPAGSSSKKGVLVIPKGTVLGPAQIAVLAAHGITRLKVIRRPVIAVIASGDELVKPGKPLLPGKSYDCNTTSMVSLISHYGAIPRVIGIARDNLKSVESKIRKGLQADAIITSGGASKGDYDLIRLALKKMGILIFSTISMGPGAAVAFGLLYRVTDGSQQLSVPLFALTGPPTGCLINLETLVRPAMCKMLGYAKKANIDVEAEVLDSSPDKKRIDFVKWTSMQRCNCGYQVQLNSKEKMGTFALIAAANSLAIIPEGCSFKSGDMIKVLPLDWRYEG